jgi:restriction system protein
MIHDQIPKSGEFFNPVLDALRSLGGSGTLEEINQAVVEAMQMPAAALEQMHDEETTNQTEVEYRLAWARTYLKLYGLIENSTRGVWTLTDKAAGISHVDPKDVRRVVQELSAAKRKQKKVGNKQQPVIEDADPAEDEENWRKRLFVILTKQLSAAGFERLVQRLLRESGFVQVEVTGRTGDGGIDGKGIARIHGLMSFHVVFQAKKYQGVVSAAQVRDFRGAMVGRADKGLLITTGSFTKDAVREATRDGTSPIDLIDGDALADRLKELSLGVQVKMVEDVVVDDAWFDHI